MVAPRLKRRTRFDDALDVAAVIAVVLGAIWLVARALALLSIAVGL